MGKLEYFIINLSKPVEQEVYVPGEQLAGTVELRVLERFKINSIQLVIDGSARSHWSKQSHDETRTYNGHQNYFNQKIVFLRKKNFVEDLTLEPGSYSYPFSYILPANIPTSFEHVIGHVRYTLNATIDIPWAKDKYTTRLFTVINHCDLNLIPYVSQPAQAVNEKVLRIGPFKSGLIMAQLIVAKTGFVPGETIICNANLNNQTKTDIKQIEASLVQELIFHNDRFSDTEVVRQDVSTAKYPVMIGPHSQANWNDIRLIVPAVCASTPTQNLTHFHRCLLIEVVYKLVFRFNPVGPHLRREFGIPVIIGTVPLGVIASASTQQASNLEKMPLPPIALETSFEATSLATARSSSTAAASAGADLPPSYEEANGDVLESNSRTFKPKYPYFKELSK